MYSQESIGQLKIDEGFSPKLYKDSLGFNTIAYGWCIDKTPCSEELGEIILRYFAKKYWQELISKAPWIESQPQKIQDIFLNMIYKLGVDNLLRFHTFIRLIKESKYREASKDLTYTLWYKQVKNRAKRIEEELNNI